MKRLSCFLLAVICALGLCGCRDTGAFSVSQEERSAGARSESAASARQWTPQDVQALFEKAELPKHWTVLDCAVAEDRAYDRVGVVLFADGEDGTTNVAFIQEDGTYQRCGVSARAKEESGLTYLGDGAVTFLLETQDGPDHSCKITFSVKGNNVSFIVEDDL